jgi:hypothetical protein
MASIRLPACLCIALIIGAPVICQEGKLRKNKETGQWEVTPEMAEQAKRQFARLRDPSFITLELVPVSNCEDEKARENSECYNPQSKISLKLLMINRSAEAITITTNKSYYSYDLHLLRDGQVVDYRKDVAEWVDKPPASVSSIRVKLDPGKAEMVELIHLASWYEPLESGHYQLDIKRRFVLDGGWTPTASAAFEVAPN